MLDGTDGYPVSAEHCLIAPRRHVAEYFQAAAEEKAAIWTLVDEMKAIIDQEYNPNGYTLASILARRGAGCDTGQAEIQEKEIYFLTACQMPLVLGISQRQAGEW